MINGITISVPIIEKVSKMGEQVGATMSLCVMLGMARGLTEGNAIWSHLIGKLDRLPKSDPKVRLEVPRKSVRLGQEAFDYLTLMRAEWPELNTAKIVNVGADSLHHFRSAGYNDSQLWDWTRGVMSQRYNLAQLSAQRNQ